MKDIKIKIKNEICKKLDVTIAQLSLQINKENDVYLHGSVSWKEAKGTNIGIKASLCDTEGNILYIIRNFSDILLDITGYNTFKLYCSEITRFIEIGTLSYIEVFPYVKIQE